MNPNYNQTVLAVQGGIEKVSTFSRQYLSGANFDHNSRHVYAVTLNLGDSGWVAPNPNDPQVNFMKRRIWPGGTSAFQTPASYGNVTWNQQYVMYEINGDFYGDNALTETPPDHLAGGAVRPGDVEHTFYLLAPGEMGNGGLLGSSTTIAPSSGATPVGALSTALPKTATVVCQLGSSAALSGGTLTCLVKSRKWWHTLEGIVTTQPYFNINSGLWVDGHVKYFWKYRESTHWVRYDFSVPKLICDDTSLDTRRMYGQPNLEGALPGLDANAPNRNVNFDPWVYRGGLFVGNIPANTGDQSGLARAQLYPRGGSVDATSKWATLSMVHMGVPPNRGTVQDLAVTAYAPSASDPNAATPNTFARWSTGWDKALATAGQAVIFSSSANTDYSNWHWDGKTTAIPTTLTSVGILLARATEDTSLFNWHYFASKEHVPPVLTLPLMDAQPRLWVVKETTVTRW